MSTDWAHGNRIIIAVLSAMLLWAFAGYALQLRGADTPTPAATHAAGPITLTIPDDWTLTPPPPGCLLRAVEAANDPRSATVVVTQSIRRAPGDTDNATNTPSDSADKWLEDELSANDEILPDAQWTIIERSATHALVASTFEFAGHQWQQQAVVMRMVDNANEWVTIVVMTTAPADRVDQLTPVLSQLLATVLAQNTTRTTGQ